MVSRVCTRVMVWSGAREIGVLDAEGVGSLELAVAACIFMAALRGVHTGMHLLMPGLLVHTLSVKVF